MYTSPAGRTVVALSDLFWRWNLTRARKAFYFSTKFTVLAGARGNNHANQVFLLGFKLVTVVSLWSGTADSCCRNNWANTNAKMWPCLAHTHTRMQARTHTHTLLRYLGVLCVPVCLCLWKAPVHSHKNSCHTTDASTACSSQNISLN